MEHAPLTFLSFGHAPPCIAGCRGALWSPLDHEQTSLQNGSQSTRVVQWSWAMVNIKIIVKSASAEVTFCSQQLRGYTVFSSKSQKKAIASLWEGWTEMKSNSSLLPLATLRPLQRLCQPRVMQQIIRAACWSLSGWFMCNLTSLGCSHSRKSGHGNSHYLYSQSPPGELFPFGSDPLYPQASSQPPILEMLTALILPWFGSHLPKR